MDKVKIDVLPSLRVLEGNLTDLYIDIPAEIGMLTLSEIRSFLKHNIAGFRQNIFSLSETFVNAMDESITPLWKAVEKDSQYMYSNLKYEYGTYINKKEVTFYKIDKTTEKISSVIIIGNEIVFAGFDVKGGEDRFASRFFVPRWISLEKTAEDIQVAVLKLMFPLATAMFRTYSDHEVKFVEGKGGATLNGITYKNFNKKGITILDSTWFTTIVRTEGFKVNGHLRLQPCGAGRTERKLIYIETFEKHGYVRKAKILEETT